MSKYTTQLRWIVKYYQDIEGVTGEDYTPVYQYLGLHDYPIFDNNYRQQLNDKIINHFLFREIGFETAAQFAHFVRKTMHENMPYYNQLYLSQNLITDPITNKKYNWSEVYTLTQGGETSTTDSRTTNVAKNDTTHTDDDITFGKTIDKETNYGQTEQSTTTFGKTVDGTSTTEYGQSQLTENAGSDSVLDGNTHERVVHSDTPMNQISNSGVENLDYASDVTYTDRESTTANVTTYGGTTDITFGGEDSTSSTSSEGGSQGNNIVHGGTDDTATTEGGTETRDIDSTSSGTTATTATGDVDFSRNLDESGDKSHNIIGYDGTSPAKLLMEFRETFINIDMQVISSLENLFFGLW